MDKRKIKELVITEGQKKYAREYAQKLGTLKNSFLKGTGNYLGILGEKVVADFLGVELSNTFDYDLVYNGLRVDVKTKECSSKPLPHYDCSVFAVNVKQDCDVYVFARINHKENMAYLLGWMFKVDFYNKAFFVKQGDLQGSNRHRIEADRYNVLISDLHDIDVMVI